MLRAMKDSTHKGTLANWGNYPRVEGRLRSFDSLPRARRLLEEEGPWIPRGNGRSYGDASLGAAMLSTLRYNRFLAFDESTGFLRCQAGVMLSEILDVFVPRGWFLPVTPGTKLITVGGAIGADVHGKNHHVEGCFGRHVERMELLRSDGEVAVCTPTENADLFRKTIGGMGLTGVILTADFRLRRIPSAYIQEETVRAPNLDAIMDLFEASGGWTYSVAWIDCLARGGAMGRSIMMRGEHAPADALRRSAQRDAPLVRPAHKPLSVPFMFPGFVLNPLTMKSFNVLYYHKHPGGAHRRVIDYDAFFYPLDGILHWNRIYGTKGFTQYQFVLPKAASREGLKKILSRIAGSGWGSFLAVLKLFGPQDDFLSFPMEGYTLALDFPVRPGLFELFQELDRMVQDYGGRLYLAKDARMTAEMFRRTYAHAEEYREWLAAQPGPRFRSMQSRRIGLTP